MKKYLKILCLCTALAMLLGGVAAAAFTDGSLITYKTPVGVMHGAGVLSGYADGSFNPTGGITREEAAKIVAFAVLGEQGVMELKRSDTGFSDLAADRWSSPYVYWAVENGIISGFGNGSFDPTGNVTGYQLAKMMLCAAGYGQNGEYSGASWESTCAKDGFAKGIFANIVDADPSRSVTREEAALYIFNGITRLEQVSWDSAQGKYVPRDGTEALDGTIAAQVYGIVEAPGQESVFRDLVTDNLANGSKSTVVDGVAYDYASSRELLGHRVAVYTNGAEGLKNRIYYISDESKTVTLERAVSSQKSFEDAFGTDFKISSELRVYTAQAALSDSDRIAGLDPEGFAAPAGSYAFFGGELIAYMPPVTQYAMLVDELGTEKLMLSGEEYDVSGVIGAEDCRRGDVVLAETLEGGLFITPLMTYTGRLERILPEDEGGACFVGSLVFLPSEAIDKTGLVKAEPELGHYYTVYYDENYRYTAMVNAQ